MHVQYLMCFGSALHSFGVATLKDRCPDIERGLPFGCTATKRHFESKTAFLSQTRCC